MNISILKIIRFPFTILTLLFLPLANFAQVSCLWAKNMGGANTFAERMTRDAAGNLYVIGLFGGSFGGSGTTDFDPSAGIANLTSIGNNDVYMAAYDNNGNYLWAHNFGSLGTYCVPGGIATDASGNLYITGNFDGTVDFDPSPATATLTAGGNAIFVAKYTAAGNYLWAIATSSAGGNMSTGLAVDMNGDIYVTGCFQFSVDFDPSPATAVFTSNNGTYDLFLAKYSASGNYLWAFGAGGGTTNTYDYGKSVLIDQAGDVILAGYFESTADFDPSAAVANLTSAGANDIFIAKYSSVGSYQWAQAMGGTGADTGNSLGIDGQGNIYLTGQFEGVADFDPSPAFFTLNSNNGTRDVFIAKYTAAGNYVWAGCLSGSGPTDWGNCVKVDGSGEVYVSGRFSGTIDIDPSASSTTFTSAGNDDIFIAKYDASGNYITAFTVGGANMDGDGGLILGTPGSLYLCGNFRGSVDFDPSSGTSTLVSTISKTDAFIAKYSFSAIPTSYPEENSRYEALLNAYPNPANKELNLTWYDPGAYKIIKMYNFSGEMIFRQEGTDLTKIDLSNYEAGIYLLEISSAGQKAHLKFVKQ